MIITINILHFLGPSRGKIMVAMVLVIVSIIGIYVIFIMVPCYIAKLDQKEYSNKDIRDKVDLNFFLKEEENLQNTKVVFIISIVIGLWLIILIIKVWFLGS